jgi:hypothetical protein
LLACNCMKPGGLVEGLVCRCLGFSFVALPDKAALSCCPRSPEQAQPSECAGLELLPCALVPNGICVLAFPRGTFGLLTLFWYRSRRVHLHLKYNWTERRCCHSYLISWPGVVLLRAAGDEGGGLDTGEHSTAAERFRAVQEVLKGRDKSDRQQLRQLLRKMRAEKKVHPSVPPFWTLRGGKAYLLLKSPI